VKAVSRSPCGFQRFFLALPEPVEIFLKTVLHSIWNDQSDGPLLCATEHLCRENWCSINRGIVSSNMTTREVNGVSVVTLEGRIVFGEESHALRAKVKSLIAEGKQKIVLNMKNPLITSQPQFAWP
jgi:hypothetical protein